MWKVEVDSIVGSICTQSLNHPVTLSLCFETIRMRVLIEYRVLSVVVTEMDGVVN